MLQPVPKPPRKVKEPRRLRGRTRIKAVNPERAALMRERNFPKRPAVVWCLLAHRLAAYQAEHGEKATPPGWSLCCGRVDFAHTTPRGMGGCNSSKDNGVYMCRRHHQEQEGRSEDFELRYGVDLTAEAAKVAAGDFGPEAPA